LARRAASHHLRRHLKLGDQAIKRPRRLNRVQILALNVLNQRHLEREFIPNFPNDRRHLGESRQLRGPPSALSGDQFVTVANWAQE
jgi:hypothetical protein